MGKGNGSTLRRFAGFMGICFLAALGTFRGSGKASAAAPEYGGTLTMGVHLEFRGFDPLKAGYLNIADRNGISAIEERLFDLDAKGNPVPELALSATPSKDKKSWTIRLRKGVVFHDGTPFNADAVVQHWARLLEPKNRYTGLSTLQTIRSVARVDDFTVRFTLQHPWAAFMKMVASPVISAAYIPSPKAIREGTQNRAPVGTGPFRFKEWVANDRLVVIKNATYWRKGKPYLDSVVFRPFPDMQARFSALQSGESDVIQTDRGASILQAREDRSLKVYSGDSNGPYTFIFNTARPPVDDARVRRALAHAWNQDFFLKADYKGTLPVAREPFGGALSCGDTGYREYDPARARKLLAEYGKPVELELLHTNTARGKEAGEIMQRLFKEVGVTLRLVPVAEGQMVKRVMGGDFQLSGWTFMDAPDMGPYFYGTLHSSGGQNFAKYRNPRMDELLTTQQMSTDAGTREKALCGVARLINEDAVYLYGGGRRYHILARTGIQGITAADHGILAFRDIWVKKGGR